MRGHETAHTQCATPGAFHVSFVLRVPMRLFFDHVLTDTLVVLISKIFVRSENSSTRLIVGLA